MERKCKKCGEVKAIEEFEKSDECKYGRSHTCVECTRKRRLSYRAENKDRIKCYGRKYYKKNKEQIIKQTTEWGKNNKDKRLKIQRKSYNKNYDKERAENYKRKEKSRKEVDDVYVRILLASSGFKRKKITPEIIELKREIIIKKRYVKELKKRRSEYEQSNHGNVQGQ